MCDQSRTPVSSHSPTYSPQMICLITSIRTIPTASLYNTLDPNYANTNTSTGDIVISVQSLAGNEYNTSLMATANITKHYVVVTVMIHMLHRSKVKGQKSVNYVNSNISA